MSQKSPNNGAESKAQRKARIREIAAQERMKHERHQRNVRLAWQGSIIAVVVAAVAVITVVIVSSTTGTQTVAGPKNMISDGALFTGDGSTATIVETAALKAGEEPVPTDTSQYPDSVHVEVYLDYMCPYCGQFETTNASQLVSMATSGVINLEYHPISILDNSSLGTQYSTRAANAAACVINTQPEYFLDFNASMFANQPDESTEGLTNDELWTLAQGAGVTDESIETCITDGTYEDWVTQATTRAKESIPNWTDDSVAASQRLLSATPTVIIDGAQYSGSITDADELASAISTAYSTKVGG